MKFINSFSARYPRLSRILPWGALILVTFFAHFTYIQNGFTWIDHGDIEGGAAILAPGELHRSFISPLGQSGFFRPTSTLTYSIDHWLYGTWAPGFHATNVALEVILVIVAVYFARRFFGLGKRESFFVSFIVGIHPLTWLPVGSIVYRGEILVTLFTFGALLAYIAARKSNRPVCFLAALLCTLFALFSKETAIFWIPSLVILWEFLDGALEPIPIGSPRRTAKASPDERAESAKPSLGQATRILRVQTEDLAVRPESSYWDRLLFRKKFPAFLLFAEVAAFALYFFLRMRALPEGWVLHYKALPLSQAVGTRLEAFSLQLGHLISPFKPALSDAITPVSVMHPLALAAVGSILAAFYLIWRFGPRSLIGRVMLFGGIALAPALNFVPIPRFTSPHYGYFAVIGVAVFAVAVLRFVKENMEVFYRGAVLLFVLWMGIMFSSTVQAGNRFFDDFTLFAPEVARDKDFIEGRYYLGTYFFEKQEYGKAEEEYEAVVYPRPGVIAFVNRPPALINLARVKAAQEEYEEADRLLRLAAEESPWLLKLTLFNRAVFAARQENYAMAVELLESLPGGWRNWDGPEPLELLLQSLINLRRFDEADEVNAKLGEFFAR